MNNTWDIIQIIDRYHKRAVQTVKYSPEGEALRELYAQNLRLQCKTEHGHIITVDDFICWLDDKMVGWGDGYGRLLDWSGNIGGFVVYDKAWLQENRASYPFVMWFNK